MSLFLSPRPEHREAPIIITEVAAEMADAGRCRCYEMGFASRISRRYRVYDICRVYRAFIFLLWLA